MGKYQADPLKLCIFAAKFLFNYRKTNSVIMKNFLLRIALVGLMMGSIVFAQEAKKSDEGMWLPMKVTEMNGEDMKAKGLEIEPSDVYSEEKASVKDAIVRMGGGFCTGEVISREGLVLTNHHCGYDAIATLSSEENDYLTDGFWAMSNKEELPVEGLFVSFLVHSEDVTDEVNEDGEAAIERIKKRFNEDGKYDVTIKSVFHGAEHYVYVYKNYTDIRMVGAPPSSIGKYGGDTDNWMWPRHTGDFSLFRIYADANNEPAEYSTSNVPYKPKHFLPISIAGVQENDYAMILGYPGSTNRYLSSSAVNLALTQSNGNGIKLMGQKLESMKAAMKADDAVRIALASDYASLSNYWKYLIGQSTMLERYDIVGVKKQEEKAFQEWVMADDNRKKEYGDVLSQIDKLHDENKVVDHFFSYFNFGLFASTAMSNGIGYFRIMRGVNDDEALAKNAEKMKDQVKPDLSNYYYDLDKEIFVKSMMSFYKDVPVELQPASLQAIVKPSQAANQATFEKKFKKWADKAFAKSVITSEKAANEFFENPQMATLEEDPLLPILMETIAIYQGEIGPKKNAFDGKVEELRKTYIKGMREMKAGKMFYPDANSTMRVTYGKVSPYNHPEDGLIYDFKTTLDGGMAKEDPTSDEFIVPAKLKELWEKKDYGEYAENGKLPVNFLSTTDITGGNSGSPVINGRGELIGCAFDGNWEAMASDIYVFPDVTRTISVDARYILFIIDKFAGAGHLLEEMDIRKGTK